MNIEQLEQLILTSLDDMKARDVKVLDVSHMTDVTDKIVVASGTSSQHVKSVAANVNSELKKNNFMPAGMEGENAGDWVIVDAVDIVVHVMLPEMRDLYALEQLWSVTQDKR